MLSGTPFVKKTPVKNIFYYPFSTKLYADVFFLLLKLVLPIEYN